MTNKITPDAVKAVPRFDCWGDMEGDAAGPWVKAEDYDARATLAQITGDKTDE